MAKEKKKKKRRKTSKTIPSPFTPMPDYQALCTPDVKRMIQKYGVKAMPKKKMVTLLEHIFKETHQCEYSRRRVIKSRLIKQSLLKTIADRFGFIPSPYTSLVLYNR